MSKKRRKRCDHCGELQEGVYKANNPYIDELYPEDDNPETWWCEGCHQSACDDI